MWRTVKVFEGKRVKLHVTVKVLNSYNCTINEVIVKKTVRMEMKLFMPVVKAMREVRAALAWSGFGWEEI